MVVGRLCRAINPNDDNKLSSPVVRSCAAGLSFRTCGNDDDDAKTPETSSGRQIIRIATRWRREKEEVAAIRNGVLATAPVFRSAHQRIISYFTICIPPQYMQNIILDVHILACTYVHVMLLYFVTEQFGTV